MKKQSILAFALIAALAGSISFPVQAENVNRSSRKEVSRKYMIVSGKAGSLSELKSALEEWCEQLQNGNWKDCPTINLPDCNPSGGSQEEKPESKPEIPDTEAPDTNQPENPGNSTEEAPDVETPDSGKPELPDEDIPEVNQPEIPDSNQPETERPDQPEIDNEQLSFAEQVIKLVNAERAKAGLHELKLDTEVSKAALVRAKEIQTTFSHTRPDGRKFSSVLTDQGIRFTGAGENIAWGQTTPEKVMEAWMNSEGHRANILNAKFTKIGVGHLQNAAGRDYWVQLFTY